MPYFSGVCTSDSISSKVPGNIDITTKSASVNASFGVVFVYQLDGTRVLSQSQTIATSTISVAHLPAGVYVATIGCETLKFVKQ